MDINKIINTKLDYAYNKGKSDIADKIIKLITNVDYSNQLSTVDMRNLIRSILIHCQNAIDTHSY